MTTTAFDKRREDILAKFWELRDLIEDFSSGDWPSYSEKVQSNGYVRIEAAILLPAYVVKNRRQALISENR